MTTKTETELIDQVNQANQINQIEVVSIESPYNNSRDKREPVS